MTSPTVSYISRRLLTALFVACLVVTPKMVRAQEPTEEEYKALTDIQAEKDAAKKTEMIIKFLREKPKTSYRPNVVAEFQKLVFDLQKEKSWKEIISLGNRYVEVAPEDSVTVRILAAAYYENKDIRGFATFAEKAYAAKPSGPLAAEIAHAYLQLGDNAKFMTWGDKALASDPDNFDILIEMTKRSAQNPTQAVKYARMMLKALPDAKKREGMDDTAWKNLTDAAYAAAYGTIGANAFENKQYTEAIKNLDASVKYMKRNESAYYWLGMSYWQTSQLAPAMLNFAKAYVLKGSTSAAAKKYLDQLWSTSHHNSLAGEDSVIQRAQQDLK